MMPLRVCSGHEALGLDPVERRIGNGRGFNWDFVSIWRRLVWIGMLYCVMVRQRVNKPTVLLVLLIFLL